MTKKSQARHTPLAKHSKVGTRLVGPLGALNITSAQWSRDLLPEFLWIASLADRFGFDRFHRPYNDLLDVLDEFTDSTGVNLGLLSDFRRVPVERREAFLNKHRYLANLTFIETVGGWLTLYPENPAAWIGGEDQSASHDPIGDLAVLRRLVLKLLSGKDALAGRVRAVPMNRLFKHDKIRIASELSIVPLLLKYPASCTPDEQAQVEAFARSTLNVHFAAREDLKSCDWASYFWRHNYDLAVCVPAMLNIAGRDRLDEASARSLAETLCGNAARAREYLDRLSRHLRIDLYDPVPDEVLFGLFGRLTRLYCLLNETVELWARDAGGIVLRCLAETAIVFAYLAKKGTRGEFQSFKEYGEGQEKLLMLHLQDNHPTAKTLEGLSLEDLAERLGGFSAELLDIELGHWTKKDSRKLAQEAGLEALYRLVFTPTSSDVHGTWVSLKQSNLITCAEALHRFHRLPSLVEPPLFVHLVEVGRELYETCISIATANKGYPALAGALARVPRPQHD
jgi:hypothetical protein